MFSYPNGGADRYLTPDVQARGQGGRLSRRHDVAQRVRDGAERPLCARADRGGGTPRGPGVRARARAVRVQARSRDPESARAPEAGPCVDATTAGHLRRRLESQRIHAHRLSRRPAPPDCQRGRNGGQAPDPTRGTRVGAALLVRRTPRRVSVLAGGLRRRLGHRDPAEHHPLENRLSLRAPVAGRGADA